MSERLSQLQAELRSATEEAEAVRVEALRIAADLRNARIEDPDHVPTLERALTDVSARTELADERSAAVREQLLELAELVADPVSGLDGEHPIALLPVRIETRFERTTEPRQLLVRIYPDEVHVDSHEPQLTDAELDSARRYWERIWRAGTRNVDAERAAFVDLARAVGTPRAAWVARATRPDPANRPTTPAPDDQPLPSLPVLPTVERSPELLTRPAQAKMLPDRWIVVGFRGAAEIVRASGTVIPERLQVGPSPDAEHAPDGIALDEGVRWLVDFDLAERDGMGIRVPLNDDRGFDRLLVLGVKASLDPTAAAARLAQLLNA